MNAAVSKSIKQGVGPRVLQQRLKQSPQLAARIKARSARASTSTTAEATTARVLPKGQEARQLSAQSPSRLGSA